VVHLYKARHVPHEHFAVGVAQPSEGFRGAGNQFRFADAELAKVLQSVASVVQALPENEIVEPLLVR
jgi:hypothetical protein